MGVIVHPKDHQQLSLVFKHMLHDLTKILMIPNLISNGGKYYFPRFTNEISETRFHQGHNFITLEHCWHFHIRI